MAGQRQYDDPCGIARGLDLLGERWALLVVRELCFVAKRFSQLRRDLPGVSPNVLSQRLDQLEAAGLLRSRSLPPPAATSVYELTERGRAVEPILIELGRWGSQLARSGRGELSLAALLLALKTTFVPGQGNARFRLLLSGEPYWLTLTDAGVQVGAGVIDTADATLDTDGDTLRALAFGEVTVRAAETAQRLTVTGSRRVAGTFSRNFRRPDTLSPV